jgi:hypothetical protein
LQELKLSTDESIYRLFLFLIRVCYIYDSNPSPIYLYSNPQSDISVFEFKTDQYPFDLNPRKIYGREYGMSKIRSVYTPSLMDLLGLHPLHQTGLRILDWWSDMSGGSIPDRRGMAALTLLISLEIWSEHSASLS